MHKQSLFLTLAVLTTSTFIQSATSLREAHFKLAGDALETGAVKERDALLVLRLLPVLVAMPQYTLRGTQNIDRFNAITAEAFKVLSTEVDLNQPFILPTLQQSTQTLNDLKQSNKTGSEFIQSLQPFSSK